MSFKIVRNAQGDVVAYGPNDDNYEPTVKSGEVLSVESTLPTLPTVIPQTITRYQAMIVLHRAGKKGAITSFLQNPSNEEAQIAWEDKEMFERDSQFIADLAPALGMTEAEVDDLFVTAAGIV